MSNFNPENLFNDSLNQFGGDSPEANAERTLIEIASETRRFVESMGEKAAINGIGLVATFALTAIRVKEEDSDGDIAVPHATVIALQSTAPEDFPRRTEFVGEGELGPAYKGKDYPLFYVRQFADLIAKAIKIGVIPDLDGMKQFVETALNTEDAAAIEEFGTDAGDLPFGSVDGNGN